MKAAPVAPFRPFFLLVALDAILGAVVWIPIPHAGGATGAGEWHRDVLLFGTIPAMLAGFLLTALPRWTGRPPIPATATWPLVALWLCGRAAFLLVSPGWGLALASLFLLTLVLVAAACILAAGDRRNVTVLLLLLVFCGSAVLTAASLRVDLALRAAVAAIVGLLIVIAGRVVPALTTAFGEHEGAAPAIRPSPAVERIAAAASACALCAWVAAPEAVPTGLAAALAACGQAVRLARWRGWRVPARPVLALHAGYGWIVAGFALLATHILAPAWVDRLAPVHAWTIGATGTLGLSIMTSMMRRHGRRAFARLGSATAASVLVTASCLSRLLAGPLPGDPSVWLALSGAFWVAAFCLFLDSYRRLRS